MKGLPMKELIDKYQKEIDFLNRGLDTAKYRDKNSTIRIKEALHVYTEVLNDLKQIR